MDQFRAATGAIAGNANPSSFGLGETPSGTPFAVNHLGGKEVGSGFEPTLGRWSYCVS
jgi:hypothetical protein